MSQWIMARLDENTKKKEMTGWSGSGWTNADCAYELILRKSMCFICTKCNGNCLFKQNNILKKIKCM